MRQSGAPIVPKSINHIQNKHRRRFTGAIWHAVTSEYVEIQATRLMPNSIERDAMVWVSP